MKAVKILLGALAVVVVIIGGGAVYVSTLDFNSYKGEIQETVKEATGRDLAIAGDIGLELSMTPRLAVSGVRFQNAAWGSKPDMVSVGELEVLVNLMPLLSSKLEVERLVLRDVELLLETNKSGKANWDVADGHGGESEDAKHDGGGDHDGDGIPSIGEVTLDNIRIIHRDGAKGTENNFTIDTIGLKRTASGTLDARIKVAIDGQSVDVTGALPAIADMVKPGTALPLSLKGSVFGFDIDVAASVTVHPGKSGPAKIEISGLNAKIEGSDVSGSASVALGGPRPAVLARLESTVLDLAALRAKAPGSAGGTAAPGGDGKDPLDQPLPLEGLKAVDADIKATVKTLMLSDKLSVADVSLVATLKGGLLKILPSSAVLSGGKVDLFGTVDGRRKVAKIALTETWKGADFGALAKVFQPNDLIDAKGDTSLKISGAGETPRQILATLGGHTALIIREGKIDNAYWELIAADVATQFLPFLDKSDRGKLNCMVSRFDIKHGIATSKAMLIDSDRVIVAGEGTIELAKQELDLKLTPQPKDPSLISLSVPVLITGPASSPIVLPDPLAVVKGVGQIALVGVNPLALALPFLSAGNTDEPCPAAIAVAEGKPVPKSAKKPAPAKAPATGAAAITDQIKTPDAVKGLFDSLKKAVD
jgi:AsmA family protein